MKAFKKKYLLVVGVLCIGIVFSSKSLAGWYGILKVLEFVFFGWYVSCHAKQAVLFLQIVFPIGIFVESILAFWQVALQTSIGGLWYFLGERTFSASTPGIANVSLGSQLFMRPYATFPHPNVLAGYLLVGLLFLGVFWKYQKLSMKILFLVAFCMGSIALVISLSRTAILLGIGITIFYLLKLLLQKTKKIFLEGMSLLMLAIAALGFLLFPRFVGVNLTGESLQLRWELLQVSWQLFLSRPLLGVGINNFLSNMTIVSPRLPIQPVHNIYLLILSETGILGFGFFVYFLHRTLQQIILPSFTNQLKKNIRTFALYGLIFFLVVGFVDHYFLTLQQGQLLSAIIFGLSWENKKT